MSLDVERSLAAACPQIRAKALPDGLTAQTTEKRAMPLVEAGQINVSVPALMIEWKLGFEIYRVRFDVSRKIDRTR